VLYGSGGEFALSAAHVVAVADVNGDGRPDLLVANFFGIDDNGMIGPVGVLLGNGDGTFETAVPYDAPPRSVSVAATDLNGDGKPDLVVASTCMENYCTNGSVSVLLNTTPWPYKAFVQQPINSDGNSIFKANRGVIPVKFTLTQNSTATCQLPPATMSVTRTAGGVIGSVDEGSYSMAADNGSNFRIDQTACQYVYNLAANVLGVGTYHVDIKLNGVAVGSAVFALK
jgi:hypothetical protein